MRTGAVDLIDWGRSPSMIDSEVVTDPHLAAFFTAKPFIGTATRRKRGSAAHSVPHPVNVMRLGLFGGTFDPVHYGHLLLAECCREARRLDAVWFMPTANPPHKRDRQPTSAEHRIAMLELAVAGNTEFAICRHEIDRGGVSYSVDTLNNLRKEDLGRELFFLMGADMLQDLPHWRDAARVCELAVPVAVHRPGAGPIDFECLREIASRERIELIRRHQVEMPQVDISASELRNRVSRGLSIRYRVPAAVEAYIATHRLYQELASCDCTPPSV